MTTLYPAPGEARPEGVITDGQEPVVAEPVEPQPNVIGRRRALWLIFGGGGAAVGAVSLGVAGWYYTRPRGNTGTAANGGRQLDGGTGANANAGGNDEAGTPVIPINARNPNHIKDVVAGNPNLQGSVRRFLGTDNITLIPPGTNNHFPWLQVTTPTHENLTLTLRPTGVETAPGERAPTWTEVRGAAGFDPNAWSVFEGGTMLRFNDGYAHGLTMASVTGYANIGTPDEHRFTIETEHLARLTSMAPDARRAEFTGLASAMLGARAMG